MPIHVGDIKLQSTIMVAPSQRTGEYKMPEIYVHAVKGRTQEQK
jgi:hypothetical protein